MHKALGKCEKDAEIQLISESFRGNRNVFLQNEVALNVSRHAVFFFLSAVRLCGEIENSKSVFFFRIVCIFVAYFRYRIIIET